MIIDFTPRFLRAPHAADAIRHYAIFIIDSHCHFASATLIFHYAIVADVIFDILAFS